MAAGRGMAPSYTTCLYICMYMYVYVNVRKQIGKRCEAI